MKIPPKRALLFLLINPLLFLILFIQSIDNPTLWAQDVPSSASTLTRHDRMPEDATTTGKIRPVPSSQRAILDTAQTVAPRQAFSLTLRATVGLDIHKCADQPIINVPANTLVVICYYITNVGSESIELHSVVDRQKGQIVTKQPFPLGPGIPALITTTATLTETTVHTATWFGLDDTGAVLASASASAKSYVDGLLVESGVRQPNGDCRLARELFILPSTVLDFCYRLVNQSDLQLNPLTLSEERVGQIATALDYPLGPGESVSLEELGLSLPSSGPITSTTDYSLTWRTTTISVPAELSGEQSDEQYSNPVPLTAVGTLRAITPPSLSGRLTVGLERDSCATTQELTVFAGAEIVFCYTATNDGAVTFTHHTVTDNFVPVAQRINLSEEVPGNRIVRERELFPMAPTVKGEFTEAQVIDQSAVVTMTWIAYSTDPVSSTVAQAPATLEFPPPIVSATATSQVSITVLPLASTSFIIYEDANQNGEQDAAELGIPNATVQLTTTSEITVTAVSDANGIASFSELPPAVYEITANFAQTPYLYEAASGNISSLLLRSGENERVALGYVQTGRRPQTIFVPIQVQ